MYDKDTYRLGTVCAAADEVAEGRRMPRKISSFSGHCWLFSKRFTPRNTAIIHGFLDWTGQLDWCLETAT
jgi:hypothetical protein